MSSAHIDLRKLRHVSVLARVGSFVGAAQELHLTQSALTRSIQSLESQLGLRIFDRARRGVRLTAAGRMFLDRGQELLIDADNLARFAQQVKDADTGQVHFGLTVLPAKLFLTPLILHFFREKPEIHCSAAVRNPDELLDLLIADQIEFVLASYLPEVNTVSLEVTDLAPIAPAFVVREGHPLLSKGALTLPDIESYPLLLSMYEPTTGPNLHFVSRHQHTVSTDDYSTLMRTALESDAVWFSSMIERRDILPHPGLARLPIAINGREKPPTLKAIKLARRTLSPLAKQVLDVVNEMCRSKID